MTRTDTRVSVRSLSEAALEEYFTDPTAFPGAVLTDHGVVIPAGH